MASKAQKWSAGWLVGIAIAVAMPGCRKEEPQQPGYGQPGYGQPGMPGNGDPSGNPLGLPCQADGGLCAGHRCNVAAQRCAFPCAGPQDCVLGYGCMAGTCVFGMGR